MSSQTPIRAIGTSVATVRAIVGRFSFDYSEQIFDNVLLRRPMAFCGIISTGTPRFFKNIPHDAQEWFSSSEIRNCDYAGVDWNTIAPLDADLIEEMRECEATFMSTVTRLEWKRQVPFALRKLWYLKHLRFWSDYLTRHRINLYLSAWIPHEIPDIVIYYLCKKRGIPVLYFHNTTVRDVSTVEEDIDASAANVGKYYKELLEQYPPSTDPKSITLSGGLAEYYDSAVTAAGEKPPLEFYRRVTYLDRVRTMLIKKPAQFFRFLTGYCTPAGIVRAFGAWHRYRVMRAAGTYYDQQAVDPDLSVPFVYFPLHYQPEASTVPMGGSYADQVLVARLMNDALPEGTLLYIKEHPRASGWLTRSPAFYEEFLQLRKIRFIKKEVDTFALRERCQAVATVTGSAGFEALFRGKPVFLFGHRFFQYAKGVHRIRTLDDCKQAVEAVFARYERPTLLDVRLYLKAMEQEAVPALLDPWNMKVSRLPKEEHVRVMTETITRYLMNLESRIAAVA